VKARGRSALNGDLGTGRVDHDDALARDLAKFFLAKTGKELDMTELLGY
jgi:hypothetical protein